MYFAALCRFHVQPGLVDALFRSDAFRNKFVIKRAFFVRTKLGQNIFEQRLSFVNEFAAIHQNLNFGILIG